MTKPKAHFVMSPEDAAKYVELERRIAAADARARRTRQQLDAGHLYVIEFISGVVKVGRTAHPEGRMNSHAGYARVHGGGIGQSWMSDRHHQCSQTEAELIAFCKKRGTRTFGREYFADIKFDVAREFAEILVVREIMTRKYAESARHLADVTASFAVMKRGAAGDETMLAVEAWNRGTAGQ